MLCFYSSETWKHNIACHAPYTITVSLLSACSKWMLFADTLCWFVSESRAGIDVTLDVSFSKPVNISSLRQTLFLSLNNLSFAVDPSSLTVTRK